LTKANTKKVTNKVLVTTTTSDAITVHPKRDAFVVRSTAASTDTAAVTVTASYAVMVRPKMDTVVVHSAAAAITVRPSDCITVCSPNAITISTAKAETDASRATNEWVNLILLFRQ
jgi:hypothetical protein